MPMTEGRMQAQGYYSFVPHSYMWSLLALTALQDLEVNPDSSDLVD